MKFKETFVRFVQGESRGLIRSFSDSCWKKSHLEQLASRKLVKSKNSSNHRYEVHPIGGEIEETHHGYTCSHCTQQFNIYCCP